MADKPDSAQTEHASLFVSDEEPPEKRFDPVEVDLSRPEPKEGDRSGVEELQRQLAEQQAATARAEAAARELAQRAQFAERRVQHASVSMIDSAIESAQHASNQAQAKFQAALDAADHRLAAQAQAELSDARHNLFRLQEHKAQAEMEAQRPAPAPRQPSQQQTQQLDAGSIMQGLVNDGFPRSAQWLKDRPELLNPQMMRKVASAHNHLVDNHGYVPESDEYFAAMEREVYRTGQAAQPRTVSPPMPQGEARRPIAAAAPVSPRTPSLRNGEIKRDQIRLTPAQREAADLSGMTDREYAESYEDARIHGKLLGTIG